MPPRVYSWVDGDPAVRDWLGHFRGDVGARRCIARHFFEWVYAQPGRLKDLRPFDLVAFQKVAVGDDRYLVLDYLRRYLEGVKRGRLGYKKLVKTSVYSFYAYNRAGLPEDPRFRLHGDVAKAPGRLDVEAMKRIVAAAKLRDRAWILCMFQGFMGIGEYEYFNLYGWPQVQAQLGKGGPVKVEFLNGRKHSEEPFYTFLGKDAVEALKQYLAVRGEPGPGEAIFLNQYGKPLSKKDVEKLFLRLVRRVGLVPNRLGESSGCRYGFNPHEMRDVARSLVHRVKSRGFDTDCAEFWMGHIGKIDEDRYDKFWKLDPGYVEDQYRLLEPSLNILSPEPESPAAPETRREVDALKTEVQLLKNLVVQQLRHRITHPVSPEDKLIAEATLEQLLTREAEKKP